MDYVFSGSFFVYCLVLAESNYISNATVIVFNHRRPSARLVESPQRGSITSVDA